MTVLLDLMAPYLLPVLVLSACTVAVFSVRAVLRRGRS